MAAAVQTKVAGANINTISNITVRQSESKNHLPAYHRIETFQDLTLERHGVRCSLSTMVVDTTPLSYLALKR